MKPAQLKNSTPVFFLLFTIAFFTKQSSCSNLQGLFVFGDSQLDAGNNVFIKNSTSRVDFPPYGETYFHRPTGRFTNGRTIADFIALHMHLPLLSPSLQPNGNFTYGANFASGGSGFLDSTSLGAGVLPMSAQMQQFHRVVVKLENDLGEERTKNMLSSSLYILTSGSNDIGINYLQNTTLQQILKPQEFIDSLMHEYNKTIMTLNEHGAKKLAVFELGVLGCTPFSRFVASLQNKTGCLTEANQMSLLFNSKLQALVKDLKTKLPDMTIVYGKTFNIFMDIMSNATSYGYVSTTSACCGAGPFNAAASCGQQVPANYPYKVYTGKYPSKYLFWDGSHPTESAYSQIFKRLWNGDITQIEPFNLNQLVNQT